MSEKFQHITSIGRQEPITALDDNIKSFLDWSFLNIGAYVNVTIPTTGIDSTYSYHSLKSTTDPSQKTKVWQSLRKDWVHESVSGLNIIPVSGLYLNSVFLPAPTGSGNYSYSINYPQGNITFGKDVSSTSKVELQYSYRYVQVYSSEEVGEWWKELVMTLYNPSTVKSVDTILTANHAVQMPAIIIEPIAGTTQTPRELGTTQNIIYQYVMLHVLAENPTVRTNIANILINQKDNTLFLYDPFKVVKNNVNQLKYDGSLNPSGMNYSQLYNSESYRTNTCCIRNAIISEHNKITNNLYHSAVRWTMEIFP